MYIISVSDSTLADLDPHGTFLAMCKEIIGLDKVQAGGVISETQARDFCNQHGVLVIGSRWITTKKAEGVRARIFVKDFARNS